MPFLRTNSRELRVPETLVLPDGRKRLTRYFRVNQVGVIPPELDLPWGTVDPFPSAPTGWTGLRLTGKQLDDHARIMTVARGEDSLPMLQLIFEQISENGETAVGGTQITKLEDGRTAKLLNFVQFSTGTYTPGTVGTSTAPSDSSAFLMKEEAPDDGTLRRITRTYVYAGLLKQDDETRNNGALLLRTLVWAKTAPTTPSGYTLVSQSAQSPAGFPVYTYVFAKGTGEISRTVEYLQSSDQGTGGITRTVIRYLTTGSVGTDPTSLEGSVKVGEEKTEQDGYRIWTITYAKGTGTVVTNVETRNGGKLVLYHRMALGAAPTTPTATIGGTVTLIGSNVRKEAGFDVYDYTWGEGVGEISRTVEYLQSSNQGTIGVTRTVIRYLTAGSVGTDPTSLEGSVKVGEEHNDQDAYRIWTVTYAKGTGLVAQYIHGRQDGLREVTNLSLGTKVTPSGAVIRDDYDNREGYAVFTTSAIQSAAGGSPTGATESFQRYVPFTYPGRAVAFSRTNSTGGKTTDVFKSPPVTTEVLATISVSYQTSSDLGSAGTYWNVGEWATIQAVWTGVNQVPASVVQALPGYRAASGSQTISVTARQFGGWTMLGAWMYGGTDGELRLSGGPDDPGNHTFTLDATIEPAFTDIGGTVYYRKIVVSALIPSQNSLPSLS